MNKLDYALLDILSSSGPTSHWTSTPDLISRLKRAGHDIDYSKQVLRRLQNLEQQGIVISRQTGRTVEWQCKPGASGFNKVYMPMEEAMALQLLKRFSNHSFPKQAKEHLQTLFAAADDRLGRATRNDEKRYASWDKKVAAGGFFQLQPPEVDSQVFNNVLDALFKENVLKIRYPSTKKKGLADTYVMPLGLVDQNGLLYLIARPRFSGDFKPNPTQYRLDRIKRAEPQAETFSYPSDFHLDAYIHQEKKMEFFVEEKITVTLRVSSHLKDRLQETPLHVAQKVTQHKDGTVTIQANVFNSLGFRQWLLGQGREIAVLKPVHLRQRMRDMIEQMSQLYR